MPWAHCEQTIPDDGPCPACGLAKSEWTIQVERTRTFKVTTTGRRRKKDAWIEVQLLDGAGRPMAGASYRVGLPDGLVQKGALDDQGKARLEAIAAGTCEVSFPGALDEPAERATGASHVFSPRPALLFSY